MTSLSHYCLSIIGFQQLRRCRTTDPAGEWGGFAREGSADRAWQERLAAFLCERGLTDNFFWCLNPNSGDTVPALSCTTCTEGLCTSRHVQAYMYKRRGHITSCARIAFNTISSGNLTASQATGFNSIPGNCHASQYTVIPLNAVCSETTCKATRWAVITLLCH